MAENESSDAIAWDCLNETDDVGTGKQPLREQPNDDHDNDVESEIDKVLTDEVIKSVFSNYVTKFILQISLTTTDCQLIEFDDNIVPTIEDEDCQEMDTDAIRDDVNERVIPSDSFFASGIGNIITSDVVSRNLYIKMMSDYLHITTG